MTNPLISIIVPVYNVEKYLRRCLDTILSQTYSNWEAILVDDGSKDKSGSICDEFAQKDNRFNVIHKENRGVSSARNTGIEKACGEWFLFCDADDLLYEDTLDNYVSRINDGINSICGGYVEIDDKEDSVIKVSTKHDYEIEIDRIDALKDFYKKQYGDFFNGYLWNRLLKADIIRQNQVRFREDIYIKEDGLFLVQFLCKSTGLHSYTSKPVYKYRRNGEGAMSTYSKSFNEKSCSNLIARCCCYETIKSVTDEVTLLTLSKNSISAMYLRLIFYFIKDKKKGISKLVQLSKMTFKCASPFYIVKSTISRIGYNQKTMSILNKVKLLISFLFLFVTTACAKDEEMEKVDINNPIDEITDETIRDTIVCSFEKYMSLQPIGKCSAQGSACYGKYFIQGYNYNGYVTIYDLEEKKCLETIEVPAPEPSSRTHSNTLNFGSQRYHSDDYFPLLYVSSGYATEGVSHIYVYRLSKETIEGKDEFTLALVQTIALYGFGTWTEGIVDADSDKLWIKCKEGSRLKYVCYNLPDISEGNVDIYSENGLRNFQVEKNPAMSRNQGHLFWNDRILVVSGVPQSGETIAFISINTLTEDIEFIIDLANIGLVNPRHPKDGTFEPESVIVYNGQLMICYRKAIYTFNIERQKRAK